MLTVDLLQRAVPAKHADEGLRAISGDNPIRPESVQKYLESELGDAFPDVSDAMFWLAKNVSASQLSEKACALYENSGWKFPPLKKDGELRGN